MAEQVSRRGEASPVTVPALPSTGLLAVRKITPVCSKSLLLPSAQSPAAEFLMSVVKFNTHRYTRIPEKSIHPKRAGVLNSTGNRSQADQM